MPLDFFLNELSHRTPAKDVREARINMAKFVEALSSLKRATARLPNAPQLRTDMNFQGAMLAPNYSVAKWRGDNSVDQVQRLLFKTYTAQAPYLHGIPEEATAEFPEVYSYHFEGTECQGLGYAHLLKGIAVSLVTEMCWDASSVEVLARYLTDEADESVTIRVPHVATPPHVVENEPFLVNRLTDEDPPPNTLKKLWENRARLFPHLDFCHTVEDNLEILEPVQHLNGVLSSLIGYDVFARKWSAEGGDFEPHAMLYVTPESSRRLKRYGEQLTFEWNGRFEVFSFHGRFTPGAGRIYMLPDLANRRLVIGYIGMKIGI